MISLLNTVVDIGLLGILVACVLLLIRTMSLLTITILSGVFSLTMCSLFVIMDAVDVAFTEAAVGAGISTILFVSVMRAYDEFSASPNKITHQSPNKSPNKSLMADSLPSLTTVVIAVALGLMLLFGTLDMPWYGDLNAPIHNHLRDYYLLGSSTEIGIPNVVTSVLASYRGYDTLGEVVVIFTAGTAVSILLSQSAVSDDPMNRDITPVQNINISPKTEGGGLIDNAVLRTVLVRIIPLVILFSLYVQFHGDYGPGGGFQAGVIFAAGLITFGIIAGSANLQKIISARWVSIGMALGVLIYGLVGIVALFLGGEFLNYSVLGETAIKGQHIGILLIELGVGVTVAFTMISLYLDFNHEVNPEVNPEVNSDVNPNVNPNFNPDNEVNR